MTNPIFLMPPPNDQVNGYDASLAMVHHNDESCRITDDPVWKEEHVIMAEGQVTAMRPEIIDGYALMDMLRRSMPVVAILEELQASSFPLSLRKKLTSQIQQLFNKHYFQVIEAYERDVAVEFFDLHPDYGGIVRGVTYEELKSRQDAEGNYDFTIKEPLRSRIVYAFNKSLPLIVLWSMANFSQHREMWKFSKKLEPANLTELLPADFEPEGLIKKGWAEAERKKMRAETERKERKKKKAVPKTRDEIIAEKNRKELAKMKRQGKITEEVEDYFG